MGRIQPGGRFLRAERSRRRPAGPDAETACPLCLRWCLQFFPSASAAHDIRGAARGVVGFAFGLFFAIRRIVGVEIAETGFTTLVTLVLFLGGIQLIGIGVLGEYLGRVYDEVKRRPNYIVKSRLGFE